MEDNVAILLSVLFLGTFFFKAKNLVYDDF